MIATATLPPGSLQRMVRRRMVRAGWKHGFIDVTKGQRVLVRCWGRGSQHRWKAGTVTWNGVIGNTTMATVRLARPEDPRCGPDCYVDARIHEIMVKPPNGRGERPGPNDA